MIKISTATISALASITDYLSERIMYSLVYFLTLPQKSKLLILPVVVLALPYLLVCIFLGGLFWASSVVFGTWHRERSGVYATLCNEGITLKSESIIPKSTFHWGEIEKVFKVKYPMTIDFKLKLLSGQYINIDFLDIEELESMLKERGIPFTSYLWTELEINDTEPTTTL